MKIIKVSTELEMSVHEFPSGTIREHNKALCELIGNGCDLVEHVMPKRLYTELKMPSSPVKEPGKCVSIHPKKSQYVNGVENCLHLWKPIGHEIDELVTK